MFNTSVKVDMGGVPKKVRAIKENKRVGAFAAMELFRLADKYVPYRGGALSKSAIISPWLVTYTMPYAHYQWDGEGFNYSKQGHPSATSHWETHVDKAELAQSITDYLRRM